MADCTSEKPIWSCKTTLEIDREMYSLIWSVKDKADKINTYTKAEIDAIISGLPPVVVPTNLSEFTDDLGSNPIHTHSQYLTEHQDLSNYIQKNYTAGLIKNDGTIDTNNYLTQHQDISGKVDKVNTAYNGNFASFNNEGGIIDSNANSNTFAKANHTHVISEIDDFPTIPDAQIQSDWNQTDNTKKDFIKNKPYIIDAINGTLIYAMVCLEESDSTTALSMINRVEALLGMSASVSASYASIKAIYTKLYTDGYLHLNAI